MLRFAAIVCLLSFSLPAAAADRYEISAENNHLSLGKNLPHYVDKPGKLTFENIQHTEFKPYPKDQINLGWAGYAGWFRFRVQNKDVAEPLILEVSYPLLDHVDLWIRTKDSLYSKKGGDLLSASTREIASPFFAFHLPLKPGEEGEVWLRVQSSSSTQVPIDLYTQSEYLRSSQSSNIWFGMNYGFLVVMILYNIFIFTTLKDIRYIFYSFSIFFSLLFFFIFNGHAALWVWPDSIRWNQVSVHFAMGMVTATSAIFGLSFLDLKKYAPRFRYVIMAIAAGGAIIATGALMLPAGSMQKPATFITMLDAIALTTAGFLAWKGGNKYARLFVAAWICYLLGALLLIGRNMGLLPANWLTNNFAIIGSSTEVVLLSLALADKVRILRHEKEEADNQMMVMQREMNQQLESTVASRTAQLQAERDKSEQLLLNILPRPVADELKEKGRASANHHEAVTVIFTDFVNFTRIAENLTPEVLVYQLDCCFRIFDEITASLGLEKIKTIGDAYLCAAGIPQARQDHAEIAIKAAMQMISGIRKFNAENAPQGLPEFVIRIGMHSGPLVSGVVGTRKFAYDIWGDTVNIAARMEQNSEPGRVNVSHSTFELLKDRYPFISRGMIQAKNKGSIQMYFLDQTQ